MLQITLNISANPKEIAIGKNKGISEDTEGR